MSTIIRYVLRSQWCRQNKWIINRLLLIIIMNRNHHIMNEIIYLRPVLSFLLFPHHRMHVRPLKICWMQSFCPIFQIISLVCPFDWIRRRKCYDYSNEWIAPIHICTATHWLLVCYHWITLKYFSSPRVFDWRYRRI